MFSAALSIALAICPRAYALDVALDVSQYAHTSWRVRDGFVNGQIFAIAQTPDGYVWLGTDSGLFRFDGIKAVPYQPPIGRPPLKRALALHAASDGTLWIGTYPGLATLRAGAFTEYPAMAGKHVNSFVEDRAGQIWMAVNGTSQLCIGVRGAVRCLEPDARLGRSFRLFSDSKRTLWAALSAGIARLSTDGTFEVFALPGQVNGYRAVEDGDGQLLVSQPSGLARFVDGHLELKYPAPALVQPYTATALLRDRDRGLWMATRRGIVHFHNRRTDIFAQADGLSGDYVSAVFEDREGSVWVATTEGLDRFRDFRIPTYGVKQGLSNTVLSVLAARDGAIWVATSAGLTEWDRGRATVFRERHQPTRDGIAEVIGRGFPDRGVDALLQDHKDRIWIADHRTAGVVVGDRFTAILEATGGDVSSMIEDRRGDILIACRDGLARIRDDRVLGVTPWEAISGHGFANSIVADPHGDRLWLGFFDGTVGSLVDGRLQPAFDTLDLNTTVYRLRADLRGAVWASTEAGLRRFKDGKSARLGSDTGLPCTAVHWSLEDLSGNVWLATPCGLVRVTRADLDARADAIERGDAATTPLAATIFDEGDGYLRRNGTNAYNPAAVLASDGRIWFAASDGVGVIDPGHLDVKGLAPPVHIEQLIVDRSRYEARSGLPLPARVRDLEIDYTALSLVASEKNQFRVKLEGRDRDWQDVGTRRQAFYTDLGPGPYRFRVMASNNGGVWNETGATLEFSIAPAYYQTRWFAALVIVGTALLLWVAYELRVAQLARQFNRTLDARVSERTRIARDLHDTLLQSFQGALLRFQSVAKVIKTRPDEASERLDRALDQAEAAITEGRNAVQGLRASATTVNDLANGIAAIGAELTNDPTVVDAPEITVDVDGASRDLNPLVRDEAYRVAAEALRNAVKHAHARHVTVTIHYEPRQLRLVIRDDGRGIDAETLARQQRVGHFGLPGMRERAAVIKGQLDVRRAPGVGTEIELSVPAAIAYATSASWWSRLFVLFAIVIAAASATAHAAAAHATDLTPGCGARIFDSSFVAIGRHPSTAMAHPVEHASSESLSEHRDEAPVIRNGWSWVAADVRPLETA